MISCSTFEFPVSTEKEIGQGTYPVMEMQRNLQNVSAWGCDGQVWVVTWDECPRSSVKVEFTVKDADFNTPKALVYLAIIRTHNMQVVSLTEQESYMLCNHDDLYECTLCYNTSCLNCTVAEDIFLSLQKFNKFRKQVSSDSECRYYVNITGDAQSGMQSAELWMKVHMAGANPTGPVLNLLTSLVEGLKIKSTDYKLNWTFEIEENSQASISSPLLEFEVLDDDGGEQVTSYINYVAIQKLGVECGQIVCSFTFFEILRIQITESWTRLQIFALKDMIDFECWTAISMSFVLGDTCGEVSACESESTATVTIALRDAPENFSLQAVNQRIRNQSDKCEFRINSDQCRALPRNFSLLPLSDECSACKSNALEISQSKGTVSIRMKRYFDYSCRHTICAAQLSDTRRAIPNQKECYIEIGAFSLFTSPLKRGRLKLKTL